MRFPSSVSSGNPAGWLIARCSSIDRPCNKCYIQDTEQTPNLRDERNQTLGAELGKVKKAGAGRSMRRKPLAARPAAKAPSARKTKAATAAKGATGKRTSAKSAKRSAKAAKKGAAKLSKAGGKRLPPPKPKPVSRFALHALDPIRKCGVGTSVQRLYRVDESSTDGSSRVHLVFFDRHGWYCEHGRDCAAVSHARKHDAGVSHGAASPHGPTHNGRMRA